MRTNTPDLEKITEITETTDTPPQFAERKYTALDFALACGEELDDASLLEAIL